MARARKQWHMMGCLVSEQDLALEQLAHKQPAEGYPMPDPDWAAFDDDSGLGHADGSDDEDSDSCSEMAALDLSISSPATRTRRCSATFNTCTCFAPAYGACWL